MNLMRALRKTHDGVLVEDVAIPAVGSGDVRIQVECVGLCRTDLYVAQGRIEVEVPRILGHEFAGEVAEVGSEVRGFAVGQRVTVMPVLACGACGPCVAGQRRSCQRTEMLGVERDGALAEYVVVPQEAVYPLPESLSWQAGAYSEPVAAAMGILHAGLQPDTRGVVYGANRFSTLALRVLQAAGFGQVEIYEPKAGGGLERSAFDFAIETFATPEAMREILACVRPFGKVVLKSRQQEPLQVELMTAIRKELRFQAVNYGEFSQALGWLVEGKLQVDDLFGSCYALESFAEAFAEAERGESLKVFVQVRR